MMTEEHASWRQIGKALVRGHVAAACSFGVLATAFASLVDPDGWRALTSGAVVDLCGLAAMHGVFAGLAMVPFSLVTAPFTCFAASRLHGSAGLAVAVGTLIGAAECGGLLAADGGF